MKVYRLEKNGIGPFVGRVGFKRPKNVKKMRRAKHARNQIKGVSFLDSYARHEEAILEGFIFGTSSKELLKAYFSYNLKPYFRNGYRIKEYEVPEEDVILMGDQLAFHWRHQKRRKK